MNPSKLMATYRPQAWLNDHAIDIDSSEEFDATGFALTQDLDWFREYEEHTELSDELADAPTCLTSADHRGPFEVDCDVAGWLEDYGFDQKSFTQEQLDELRKLYAADVAAVPEPPPSRRHCIVVTDSDHYINAVFLVPRNISPAMAKVQAESILHQTIVANEEEWTYEQVETRMAELGYEPLDSTTVYE